MSSHFTILHLSDLHFDHRKTLDRQIVIDALFADIKKFRSEGGRLDVIVFTGDLVQAGSELENFQLVKSTFIEPLLCACDLGIESLILVPGNHDISKSEVVTFVDSGLRAEFSTVEKINTFVDTTLSNPSAASKAALSRMQNYKNFSSSLGLGPFQTNNDFLTTQILSINGLKVGFAGVNSAWRSTGAPGDQNYLIVGERVVDIAVKDLAKADIRVCALHHPFSWLSETDASAVESRLYSSFDLLCFGHVHRSAPMKIESPHGTAIMSHAGALYASRKYYNGYQIIQWDEVHRTVNFKCRSYFDTRRAFAPAEDVSPGGVLALTLRPRVDQANFSEVELFLRQARHSIRAKADNHISFTTSEDADVKDDITEVFVCPPLTRHQRPSDKIESGPSQAHEADSMDLETMLKSGDNLLLVGGNESGRTSLIHFMAVRTAEGVSDKSRIPAVLNMRLLGQVRDYERAIKAYYSDSDNLTPPNSRAIGTLDWAIFLDDFDGTKSDHMSILAGVISKYPRHRLVVVTTADCVAACEQAIGPPLKTVDIGFLPRKSIRQLSRLRYKGDVDSGLDDPAYQLVMQHINRSRLPRTGYIVTLLIWAAEKQKLQKDLNEAVLLENLISFLLGKTKIEAALRDKFDPRAQEFLLRAIAVELRSLGGWMESNSLLQFVLRYFDERGLSFGARQVLDQFIACRLLIETDGFISFRYSCYQDYFIALDLLRENAKFGALLKSSPVELLSYAREIDLWSSLSREYCGIDQALLKIARVQGSSDKPIGVISDLADIKYSGTELGFKPSRVKEILENKLTKDQIDQLLDTADQRNHKREETGAAPDARTKSMSGSQNGLEPLLQRRAIEVLTRVARNADHEKVESKRNVVLELLRLWSSSIYFMVTAFSEFVNAKRVEILSSSALSGDDLDKILNIFRILFPASDFIRVTELLGAESLRPILVDIALEPSQSEGVKLLAAIAAANSWDRDGINLVAQILKQTKVDLLKRVALTIMLNDLIFERYRATSLNQFADAIAELEISLGSSKASKGARVKKLRETSES